MRALLLALPAALTLSACVEIDMTVEVLGEDEARLVGVMQMQRMIYDMSGGDDSFCSEEDGGVLTLTDTHARCEFDMVGSFEELMRPDGIEDTPTELQGNITYLGDNRVQVWLPMDSFFDEMSELEEDPQMMAMMRQMMQGMSISFHVQGASIESSTGTISADGTRASVFLGVDELFAPAAERMGDFETIARY